MTRPFLTGGFLRFSFGIAGSALSGFIVFRETVFQPERFAFQCLTVGALAAGILTLVRLSLQAQAFGVALAWGIFRMSLNPSARWTEGLAGMLLGLGIFLVALIYHELARHGIRLGKFLVAGPLLGGVYLALAPLAEFHSLLLFDAMRPLMIRMFLGVIIGNGVGLGVELAELLSGETPHHGLTTGSMVQGT